VTLALIATAPFAAPARGDGAPQVCPNPSAVLVGIDPDSGLPCNQSDFCTRTPSFCGRGDISALVPGVPGLPSAQDLQDRLVLIDCSPHSVTPLQIFQESPAHEGIGGEVIDGKSRLFQYYLLDSNGFQPSVFTQKIAGINDDPSTMKTVWGANCNLPTIGAVRVALEPKPDKPTDPADPRAFIDIFTDIRGLFVINNESGWYEGWMIHDLRVADVDPNAGKKRPPAFGMISSDDLAMLAAMGAGNNGTTGNFFTVDGKAPHFPDSGSFHFPDVVPNIVPIQLSMGAYNAMQQSDAHAYWEFNYTTNWIHPLYELPFAGGFPDVSPTDPADTYQDGEIAQMSSVVPGDEIGENLFKKLAVAFGDKPDRPRDPDLFDSNVDAQREFRQRFVPSGIAHEAFLNAFERLASFEPGTKNITKRLQDGYKAAVALVDTNGDGIISAAEGDVDTPNPHCLEGDNSCIFLPATSFNRFAVTREINDGMLAPRFAPSTRGWVLSGQLKSLITIPPGYIEASEGRDADDR
jgi:hypothetical protein